MDMIEKLLQHPVFHNPLFEELSKAPLNPSQMVTFWNLMNQYCSASRQEGSLIETLGHTNSSSANALKEIFQSEASHGKDLATLAWYLLWCSSQDGNLPFGLSLNDSEEKIADVLALNCRVGSTPSLLACIQLFNARQQATNQTMIHHLGRMLAAELIANRVIIPGEKKAFIDSQHYAPADLTDEECTYLRDHLDTEEWHEQHMLDIARGMLSQTDADRLIEAGALELCDATNQFFNELLQVVITP